LGSVGMTISRLRSAGA